MTLTECNAAQCTGYGFVAYNGSCMKLKSCMAQQCRLSGVHVVGSRGSAENCSITDAKQYDMFAADMGSIEARNCTVTRSGLSGFQARGSAALLKATGCEVDACNKHGFSAHSGGRMVLKQCQATAPGHAGFQASGKGTCLIVTDSTADRSRGAGFHAVDKAHIEMLRCNANLSHCSGLCAGSASKARAWDCTFCRNLQHGMIAASRASMIALRCTVQHNGDSGFRAVHPGTLFTLTDSACDGGRVGCSAYHQAQLVVYRLIVRGSTDAGFAVYRAGSITLQDCKSEKQRAAAPQSLDSTWSELSEEGHMYPRYDAVAKLPVSNTTFRDGRVWVHKQQAVKAGGDKGYTAVNDADYQKIWGLVRYCNSYSDASFLGKNPARMVLRSSAKNVRDYE